MLRLAFQKIKNKKWLTLCLVLGLTLLIVVVSVQPMFREGALTTMLEQTFTDEVREKNTNLAVVSYKTEEEVEMGSITAAEKLELLSRYKQVWGNSLPDIPILESQISLSLIQTAAKASDGTTGHFLSISYMPEIDAHIELIKGEVLETALAEEEGVYPFIVPEKVYDEKKLCFGCTYEFSDLSDESGNPLRLKLVGVFKESDSNDLFWNKEPNKMREDIFVSLDTMETILRDYKVRRFFITQDWMLDYRTITSTNMPRLIEAISQFEASDPGFSSAMDSLLISYPKKSKSLSVMLWVLELPMLGMALAFIFMVANRLMESERGEIAMLMSRGFRKGQIVYLYFVQTLILAVVSFVIGVPLSYVLCKIAASTTNFLGFGSASTESYIFVSSMPLYGLGAAAVGILFVIGPAVFASNTSIVEYMSSRVVNKKMFWEKYFLDVVLLGLSIYLLYNFRTSTENIRNNILKGGTIDPVIFVDSVLFITAFGLVALRLSHYLVKLVYRIGRKKWKPAMYASFLQITRNFGKMGFISVFMILTVALGIYYANGATTINRNKEERISYEEGCDAIFMEKWLKMPYRVGNVTHIKYYEPDFSKYEQLKEEGLVESLAQVQIIDETVSQAKMKNIDHTILMGINTKQFGETAELMDELNKDVHWYTYLNTLNKELNGAVISRNLAQKLEVDVGNSITVYGKNRSEVDKDQTAIYKIVAVVDAWPGFTQYTYKDGVETEQFLVVVNMQQVIKDLEQKPYQIWVRYADGVSGDTVRAKLDEMQVDVERWHTKLDSMERMKAMPEIRITNGIFTLGFMIALTLCGIGFLIYWISSIRNRELLFGVYRAMGMQVGDINKMLLNEHLFSTLISVIAGGVVGMVSTFLFSELVALVYLPERHNLGLYVYYQLGDIVKMFIGLVIMILICLVILRKIVKSIKISEALKLGED